MSLDPGVQVSPVGLTEWVIDSVHSNVEFSVRHMMIATFKGRFSSIEGTIRLNEANPEASSANALISTKTLWTGNDMRDEHLRATNFLDTEQWPHITFTSTRVVSGSTGHYALHGDLTIRGVTRPIVLDIEYGGQVKDMFGKQRIGFAAIGEINRKDFGIEWNAILDNGGLALGEQVKLVLNVEAVLPE